MRTYFAKRLFAIKLYDVSLPYICCWVYKDEVACIKPGSLGDFWEILAGRIGRGKVLVGCKRRESTNFTLCKALFKTYFRGLY